MQPDLLQLLSPNGKELVAQIEAATHLEIEVEIVPGRRNLACNTSIGQIKIFSPSAEAIGGGGGLHELLHIKRFALDGIPMLNFCDCCYDAYDDQLDEERWIKDTITAIDNNIEHLTIVPEEIHHFPDRFEHWETMIRQSLARNPESAVVENWPLVHIAFPNSSLPAELFKMAEKLGQLEKALAFNEAVVSSNSKKELAIEWIGMVPRLPMDCTCLEFLNYRNGRRNQVKLVEADL